ncbi:helix-turn-helix transcriptional regulator [Tenacibaculum maritimum]|uniref:helix-turn-helix domain-containing protein n=1 Tax=Tenacibaculum maritimum TaxID=107401 RepID=UPI00133113A4|nr:helix-turn-helix transcriptional regulator [Tenacibaculum maritimum]
MDLSERKEYLIRFGKNFRKIRKSRGYTQAQLAIDLDSDVSFISRIERGLINTTVIKLKEVSDILNVSINHFFDF